MKEREMTKASDMNELVEQVKKLELENKELKMQVLRLETKYEQKIGNPNNPRVR